jgi:Uma2 family endonuclease
MATVTELPAISPDSAGLMMTAEEFDAIVEYDECFRYELIQGVLIVTPIPLKQEANPNETLGGLLFVYKKYHAMGSSLDQTLPERYLYIGENRRRADRVIWAGLGRRPNPKDDPPTIAVEFVLQGKRNWRRDDITKRTEYLGLGVVEYWIIDHFQRIMTVYQDPTRGSAEVVVAEGETYQTPLLPGFELPLSDLLDAADAWRDPS